MKKYAGIIFSLLLTACLANSVPSTTLHPPTGSTPIVSDTILPTQSAIPSTGYLVVQTTPAGAQVKVDGKVTGTTPLKQTWEAGEHTVRIEADGYDPIEQVIYISPTHTVTLALSLQLAAETVRLTELRGVSATHAVWSSDSRFLIFALGDQWSEPHEWIWYQWDLVTRQTQPISAPMDPLDEATRQKLGIGRIEGNICDSSLVSVSPQRNLVVYTKIEPPTTEYSHTLWLAQLNGRGERPLGHVFSRGCNVVRWSPVGDQLLVATAGEAGEPQIYLADIGGGSFERLERDILRNFLCQNFLPRFSPDGTMLLYSPRNREEGKPCTIELFNLDTHGITPITNTQGLATWSNDGNAVYVLSPPLLTKILVNATPPTSHILAENIPGLAFAMKIGGGDEIFAVSPDETMVAFVGGNIDGPRELRVVRLTRTDN